MDLERAFLVLRQWWPVLVIGTILAAGVAYTVSKAQPLMYQGTALLSVNPGIGTIEGGQYNEVQAAWAEAAQDAQVLRTGSLATAALQKIAGQLHHTVDAATLLANTTASNASQSTLINVTVKNRDSHDVVILANALAQTFAAQDRAQRTSQATAALTGITTRIAAIGQDAAAAQSLPPAARAIRLAGDQAVLASLEQEASIVQLRRDAIGSSVSLVQPATPAQIPTKASTNTLIAAVLAFLILLGLAFLRDYLAVHSRDTERNGRGGATDPQG